VTALQFCSSVDKDESVQRCRPKGQRRTLRPHLCASTSGLSWFAAVLFDLDRCQSDVAKNRDDWADSADERGKRSTPRSREAVRGRDLG